MEHSIRIRNLGKRYKLYASRRDRLKDWLLPFGEQRYEEKWVLQDINLEIGEGEAVGLVGMNGAGKSTLLKIVTGTTIPTTGTVELSGNVSALLELGLGFHPDFTGRQNVYMSGQLLGYSSQEIAECMQAIEEFAEIGAAIDEQVRTYSSGMQVRLAFSVATMKRPDVLIVDEALSVGDAYFQHKSFARIREFKQEGTTLLIVSHDRAAIQSICDRAVLLSDGRVKRDGDPEYVMNYYNAMLSEKNEGTIKETVLELKKKKTTSGNGAAVIQDIKLTRDGDLEEIHTVEVGENVALAIQVVARKSLPEITLGIAIKNRYGEEVYGINTFYENKVIHDVPAQTVITYTIRFPMNIGVGKYSVTTALVQGENHLEECYEWKDFAYFFEVMNHTKNNFVGSAWLNALLDIQTEKGNSEVKRELWQSVEE